MPFMPRIIFRHAAFLHFLHHALHVVELFQKAVNILHLHAATGCDTALQEADDVGLARSLRSLS